MSADGNSHNECECGLMAFEPKLCAACCEEGNNTLRYCTDCRGQCVKCGETFCAEHRQDAKSAGMIVDVCNECFAADREAEQSYKAAVEAKRMRKAS